ncbi:TIGR04222 domain-containing membrane protein [Streptomyces sp. NEAU-H22]|uniref:TIGR04222 domain-containing membrane protein n=1 Tax=unclassified Streptomyces TaxID=2593676 RepID=UPI00225A98A2|nr:MULTISPECIES: TIGR04222 domain-containing membrane protein [unclassified Streptomyces]MCX3287643.1 TIGR04222 domain-containing membrane protein [Streptomyces sp. NEAU-H22]WMD05029.1 TIGR04222 domain-containing membrane protein [Streptomyces sp. FXY-T5]
MHDGTAVRLEPHEIALLGEGPRAAVTVAVVELHLRGLVEADLPGTVRAGVADAGRAEQPPSPLAAAVHACLRAPAAPTALVKDPEVRLAVAVMRIPLAEAGLLRRPLLGVTRAAHRHVRDLRREHPLPASRHGLSDRERLLLVALHGEGALRLLVPRFALRAGLVRRAEVGRAALLKDPPRGTNGGGGAFLSCGGGGGGGGGGGE